MLDIEEIKKRLEAGEVVELECIDLSKFLTEELNCKTRYNKKCMAEFNSLVDEASDAGVTMEDGFFIDEEELKFFRIVEAKPTITASYTHTGVTSGIETTASESKPTFDDLIDVAVQAVKDEVVAITILESDYIEMNNVDGDLSVRSFYASEGVEIVKSALDWINSLYTETFVIDDYKDIKRIKKEADINLANELKVKAYDEPFRHDEGWKVRCANGQQSGILDIFALKGATVTQKRGKQ